MKVLVINGSPKRENSDTMHITRAFLAGMQEVADVEMELLHAIDCRVAYCTGCFTCKRNGGTCIHQDDMAVILEKILESDVLLFSFPLYCYGMPASLKVLLDRTMPLSSMTMRKVNGRYEHVGQRDFSKLKYVMICGCGFPNSKRNFEPAVEQFGLMFPANRTVLTVPESPMFNVPAAEVVTAPRLALVKRAGREFALNGTVAQELLEQIDSPMIPEEEYAAIANGEQP